MRAILAAALCASLTATGSESLAAQADSDTVRVATRQKLEALLAAYPLAREMQFQRSAKEPFNIAGSYSRGLRYVSTFEIVWNVTTKQTIGLRIYPHWNGAYINLTKFQSRGSFMESLLHDANGGFFHWAVDPSLDVFAGFTFTLESGFPDDAIREVILSIPLLDGTVGKLMSGAQ
jgi:hypothetical protein